jgi:ribosome biogenesis protein SSF1/2
MVLFFSGGNLSESEAEFDGPDSMVQVPEEDKKSNSSKSSTSAIRLYEIGPRMKLKLVKIEEGVCDGEVLFHDLIQKTPEEIAALKENLKKKK